MELNNSGSLRAMLEQMPSEELDRMLKQELKKEKPDAPSVRLITDILWEREKNEPMEMTPEITEAWETYQQNIETLRTEEAEKTQKRSKRLVRWLSMAALLAVVCITVIPQTAKASNFWTRLTSFTEDIFQFISPGAEREQEKYVFTTDNEGLQQVYDAVVEMGVTEPVVPMWLPEGYELIEIKTDATPAAEYVHAILSNGKCELVFKVNIYNVVVSQDYDKDATQVDCFEKNGMTYNVFCNKDTWTAIYTKDNLECSIGMDCQEEIFERILKSVYTMEDN